jgi:hypothetical protein
MIIWESPNVIDGESMADTLRREAIDQVTRDFRRIAMPLVVAIFVYAVACLAIGVWIWI